MGRAEVKRIQPRVIESYAHHGGYAAKWNDEYGKGKPDLVCSMPGVGAHLVEVKHRPDLDPDRVGSIKNLMEPRQVAEARRFIKAGGVVACAVVIGASKSISDARMALFDPEADVLHVSGFTLWVPWCPRNKFDVPKLLRNYGAYDE